MSLDADPIEIHASMVRWRGRGIALLGPSGAGKSRAAAALLARGAWLVADDRVLLSRRADRLLARAPTPARGALELRGLGVFRPPTIAESEIDLAALCGAEPGERLPEPAFFEALGTRAPMIALSAAAPPVIEAIEAALFFKRIAP